MSTPVFEQLRTMKGRGWMRPPLSLKVGDVVRVDGVKYRVQEPPVTTESGSVRVEGYSEDNQHESLFLSNARNVHVIGAIA